MMDYFPDSLTGQLIEHHNKIMNNIIKNKLLMLKGMALKCGEIGLAVILSEMDLESLDNIYKVKQELEKEGYSMEVEQPQVQFTSNDKIFKATIETDKIKLKVRKIIIEV